MNNLTKETLLLALPSVLQEDPCLSALAESVAGVLEERAAETDAIRIYPEIDRLPADLLDILANDYKVDWYNYDYPVEAKRNLIKTAWYVHRSLGTTGAVRAAVQAVYPRSEVEEWWQDWYQGDPYHFRIVLESAFPIVPFASGEILRQVEIYKSFRSVLDGIIFRSSSIIVIGIQCGWIAYSSRRCGTFPERARQGEIDTFPIVVETAKGGMVYRTPFTGEPDAGTWPETATQGSMKSANLKASSPMEGVAYAGKMCGTMPGLL